MRWLVTGAGGMLGRDLVARLTADGADVVALTRAELDVTDGDAVAAALAGVDVVVNCAAWTDVDGAESQPAVAGSVNVGGTRTLARACRRTGAWLVQVSTDYVFAGDATEPYAEDAPLAPVSVYGRTKAEAEDAVRAELPDRHLVLRTAWLYGAHGGCFPRTIGRLALERPELRVVEDQVGQPTWTCDVADLVVRLVRAQAPAGAYHATSSGSTSWWGFAREVARAVGVDPEVVRPVGSEEFVRPAERPAYSVLSHAALEEVGVAPIGDWRERWLLAAPVVLEGIRAGG